MTLIKQVTVTPYQAHALELMGFVLKLVSMHMDGMDTYKVFVKVA